MVRNMNWKSWVILGLAVTILVTSGSLVMASNMGFKINKQIFPSFNQSLAPKRFNWISLPYNSPYTTAKSLCTAMGSSAAGTVLLQINPAGGNLLSTNCLVAGTQAIALNRGIRVTTTGATPSSAIFVGSSNETTALPDILGGFSAPLSPKGENWISVPYHTTWAKAEDVCVTLGLATGAGNVIRINGDPAVGTNTVNHPCGGTVINNFSLVMGEAINVRKITAGNISGKLPPHF